MNPPPQPSHHHSQYLKRLEKLVRVLIGKRFQDAGDLWRLQTDLLALQQDLQDAIGRHAGRVRNSIADSELADLRWVRWNARHFGDAIAWLLLGLDRRVIYSLGANDPVPIAERGHGTKGVLAIATGLADQGQFGFPVLHDITDCLRIGDLTFVRASEEPLTLEVKTRFVEEEVNGASTVLRYEATVLADSSDSGRAFSDFPATARVNGPGGSRQSPRSHRVDRQMKRLATARATQTVGFETPREVDGQPTLAVRVDDDAASDWQAVQEVTRLARRRGYASRPVDGCFLYAAFYDPSGLDVHRMQAAFEEIGQDLAKSGIIGNESSEHLDSLLVCSIPSPDRRRPGHYLPYFLYPLPQATICDILHGRMVLFNLVNTGALAARVEEEGCTVEPGDGDREVFVVTRTFTDGTGRELTSGLRNLRSPFNEMMMEFRPATHLRTFVRAAFDACERVGLHELES